MITTIYVLENKMEVHLVIMFEFMQYSSHLGPITEG